MKVKSAPRKHPQPVKGRASKSPSKPAQVKASVEAPARPIAAAAPPPPRQPPESVRSAVALLQRCANVNGDPSSMRGSWNWRENKECLESVSAMLPAGHPVKSYIDERQPEFQTRWTGAHPAVISSTFDEALRRLSAELE
jgi:hypothetical protein